ncbi:hypothetical protein CHRYSEO8AT_530011 [Chryseobacterium sp. 8AT]|nr:hypothetical protein CHRYSEO8AT_530011 [Chryseobacterium sp. 8AT]
MLRRHNRIYLLLKIGETQKQTDFIEIYSERKERERKNYLFEYAG